jgi:hypothetical protein
MTDLNSVKQARIIRQNSGVTYPVLNGNDSDLSKRIAYGWPAYIVDAGGVIRYTQVGFKSGMQRNTNK